MYKKTSYTVTINPQEQCPAAQVTETLAHAANKLGIFLPEMLSELKYTTPMFTEKGELDIPIVTQIAEYFGLTFETLMDDDISAVEHVVDAYPAFFGERTSDSFLAHSLYANACIEPWDHIRRLQAAKFNSSDLIGPAVYEKNNMDNRVRELFAKALHHSLTEAEINEYNLLVTAIDVKDPYLGNHLLHYSVFQKLKTIYVNENFPCNYLITDVKNAKDLTANELYNTIPFEIAPKDFERNATRLQTLGGIRVMA